MQKKKGECPFPSWKMRKQATFMHAPRTLHSGYDGAIEGSAAEEKAVKKGRKTREMMFQYCVLGGSGKIT